MDILREKPHVNHLILGVKGLNLLSRSCYPGLIPNSQNYFKEKCS